MLEVKFAYWLAIWHSIQTGVAGYWILFNIITYSFTKGQEKVLQMANSGVA